VAFSLGVSVLPWLAACAVGMAWAAAYHFAGGMLLTQFWSRFTLLPAVVLLLALVGTRVAETARLETLLATRFAVGGVVAAVSGLTGMLLGTLLRGEDLRRRVAPALEERPHRRSTNP
jgi:hypothetical protein